MVTFVAGQLPKELGKLVNLTHFDAVCNSLSGVLSVRSERLHSLLICFTLFRMLAKGARKARQFETFERFQQQD